MAKNSNRKLLTIYSVSQLTALIKGVLEANLPARLCVRGQISDWKKHPSGHCYFILKDADSQLPCVMWSNKARQLKFQPENGLDVLATGTIEVFFAGGKYQFYAENLDPAGIGSLQLAFEQMRQRLEAEGLFDPAHKKPLPRFPMHIGVITSAAGAAIADIRKSIFDRWPCATLYVFDVPVQGEGAAVKIAQAIRQANQLAKKLGLELLIVGRGGGSMEDLWAFNEEPVARAIFASKLPVISAVGHEVDVTIADLVADQRASTPTRAGVIAVPDRRQVEELLDTNALRLRRVIHSAIQIRQMALERILASAVFRTPYGPLRMAAMRTDQLEEQLRQSVVERISQLAMRLVSFERIVGRLEPWRVIAEKRHIFQQRIFCIHNVIRQQIVKKQLQMTALEHRLSALNPRAVLQRGYTLTIHAKTGQLVVRPEQVEIGDILWTELANQRRIESQVRKVK